MNLERKSLAIQWIRVPDQGPIKPGDIDNGPEIFALLPSDLLACEYDNTIGDHMMMVRSPYSPDRNGLATLHPGDWLYFTRGDLVVVPDYMHRALTDGLAWECILAVQEGS
jgi:hypothetical protein